MEYTGFLKCCPFCGGQAKLEKSNVCGGHGFFLTLSFVKCTVCGARGSSVDDYSGNLDITLAVNKWNSRIGD